MLKKEINLMSYKDILRETAQIKEVPLAELHDFTKHPYQVREDKEFEELVQSIKEHGILTPGVAKERTKGGYELISGHRRKRTCEELGLKSMSVIVKELSDDEAAILVVDSNVQRREVFLRAKRRKRMRSNMNQFGIREELGAQVLKQWVRYLERMPKRYSGTYDCFV
ncbi:MAG: ParB/RepB/Spo0J family partition protein [Synergistaceae bacterium]|nr:ParB/RepB/Spo0J family partition protein [Synergistaceae bacterium]